MSSRSTTSISDFAPPARRFCRPDERTFIARVQKPRIAAVVEHYLPGFRAGGPMQSVAALVQQLGHEIEFYVITRDRDEGDRAAYPGLHTGEFKSLGKA